MNSLCPGDKIFNSAMSTAAPPGERGDLTRNGLRGFDAFQADFVVQRAFALSERFRLQSRAEFFNIFNHPNFGSPVNYLTSPQFGQSTQTLNRLERVRIWCVRVERDR